MSVANDDTNSMIDDYLIAFLVYFKIHNNVNRLLLHRIVMLFDLSTISYKLQLLCEKEDEECYNFLFNIIKSYSKKIILDIESMFLINADIEELSREIMPILTNQFKYDRHYFTFRWYPKNGPNKFVMVTRQHIENVIASILSDIVNSWVMYLRGKKVTNEQIIFINNKINTFKKMYHAKKIRVAIQKMLID